MRRIGVLLPYAADDREGQARLAAFQQALAELGWSDGGNVRIDTRWGAGDTDRLRRFAAELVALAPDVILASGGSAAGPLLQLTRTVPIVFTQTPDPVGAGYVESLARPGGNATGFTLSEYGISAKLLEALKEIAPSVTRAAVLRDPTIQQGIGSWVPSKQRHHHSDRGEPNQCARRQRVRAGCCSFRAHAEWRLNRNGERVGNRSSRDDHCAGRRHQLPAVYPLRLFVIDGGLISYGADSLDPHRRAASYVDRILKGEKDVGGRETLGQSTCRRGWPCLARARKAERAVASG